MTVASSAQARGGYDDGERALSDMAEAGADVR